jgi:hypothetical protein
VQEANWFETWGMDGTREEGELDDLAAEIMGDTLCIRDAR